MKRFSQFVDAVLAGISIAIGGTVYLSCENKVVGAVLFCLGLFAVCTCGFNLFTGKVGYVFEQPLSYTGFVAIVWLGNLAGTVLMGNALRLTRIAGIAEKAAVLCNILMFVAVDGYRNNPHEIGKYLGIFWGVIVFIVSGFEHCVANMFYFTLAGMWSGKAVLYLLVMTVGNACGGVLIPLCRQLRK